MRTTAALLVLLLALAATVSAQTASAPDAQGLADETVGKGKSIVDKAVDGIAGAAKGVGNAAQSAGDGLGAAAGAVGRFFRDVGIALADGAALTARLFGLLGLQAADGLAVGVLSLSNTGSALLSGVGNLASDLTGVVGGIVASAATLIASGIAQLTSLYAGFVATLRPRAMPESVFDTIAITATTVSSAAAGYGLWALARKLGVLSAIPGLGLFSRIEDDAVLHHPMRAQIFQVIQANPGIHASELARRVDSGWGTIIHHLDKLEKAKLLAVRKVNNQKCYFESGGKVSRVDMQVASAVRGDSANQIAAYVTSHPMTSQKSMAGQLGISPALASFHVKKLVALGVLDKVRRGKETLLTTTDSLRRILAGESAVVEVPVLVMAPLNA